MGHLAQLSYFRVLTYTQGFLQGAFWAGEEESLDWYRLNEVKPKPDKYSPEKVDKAIHMAVFLFLS